MTNFNLRLDEKLKKESFAVIESFGLTPSQFIRLILKQVADTESLPLSFEKRDAKLSKKGEKLLQEAIDDFEQGRVSHFDSVEEFIKAASR